MTKKKVTKKKVVKKKVVKKKVVKKKNIVVEIMEKHRANKPVKEIIREIEEERQPNTRENIEKNHARRIKIMEDPNIFERIVETELDKAIVGEMETRKVIVLCAYGGRLVDNSQIASFNLLINDDAGVGKDYVTDACMQLLPKQNFIKKTRISPNVLNYWHNAEDEPQWTWDGKVLYLEDISESILNHDVFKVMCSSGSSATIVKDQKIIELEVKGKPVMITTTATATPSPELVRRFVIVSLDSSKSQTKEIMKRCSEFREKGIIPQIDLELRDAMQCLNQVKVSIPFACKIHENFPEDHIIMRTHYPRFLDFISASAALHQFQRETEEGFVVAQGEDYNLARECFLKVCSNRYMIPLSINQKKILQKFEEEPLLEGCANHLYTNGMNFISDRALIYNLNKLANYSLLETFSQENSQKKEVTAYRLPGSYVPNKKLVIPTYEEINRIASPPSAPSPPSIPSIPSQPNNKNNNTGENKGIFNKEDTKEAKDTKPVLGEANLQQQREDEKIMEDFE